MRRVTTLLVVFSFFLAGFSRPCFCADEHGNDTTTSCCSHEDDASNAKASDVTDSHDDSSRGCSESCCALFALPSAFAFYPTFLAARPASRPSPFFASAIPTPVTPPPRPLSV